MKELTVSCPKCGADIGYKCFTATGRTVQYGYHIARQKAVSK